MLRYLIGSDTCHIQEYRNREDSHEEIDKYYGKYN